ncbi:tetratricopeptide repeat protein [Xanthovirga aplysinae]|uniref:tetratricopeptide repeat protein n=1 Tax=Xanthovirga aplysinae TaxID=2529853 RepID=UPI0012BD57A3|nr:tetratricopeptide repeat protein [Xanthovirga aplysinae]MTI31069.1 tetratricopeptide repeat protein [Xanthovirga aplysinae]
MRNSILIFIFSLFFSIPLFSQPNCEAYRYQGDTLKYLACMQAKKREGHYQFSREYQEAFDEAIGIDSTFDYAYREKSVAYLKSGDFITWKNLIDKAVALNPEAHLGARGWCRYQFFRDYKGAIEDIENFEKLVNYDVGYSVNGVYHLSIAKAICYKALGQKERAISIIEEKLKEKDYFAGIYDYLHLGVLYLELGRYEKAISAFVKQSQGNEIAENQYYLGMVYKKLGNKEKYVECLQRSQDLYVGRRNMYDPYTHPYDKVYLEDIQDELEKANKDT